MALTGPIYDKSFELADRCVALYKVLQRNRDTICPIRWNVAELP